MFLYLFYKNNKMDLKAYLETEGYSEIKEIPGKGICGLKDFIFTTGLIIGMTEIGYLGRYCYPSESEALDALNKWNGEGDPSGPWIKYKGSPGERSNPLIENGCLTCKANG
jgi:hypothetical protein